MITKILQTSLLMLLSAGALAEGLRLTFSDTPQRGNSKVYGTVSREAPPVISTRAGQQVVVEKQRGRDFQLQALPQGRAFFGTGVQQVPRDTIRLVITPTLDGEQVSLDVEYRQKQGDDVLNYSGTVSGKLGEWIPLLSNTNDPRPGSKSWSAGQRPEQLSVRVDPI